ncbi:MAG: group II truncated hemoglobin [Gammaproteobacteria bacterium]|nr:group II truncated hemoglobin [Gammaproteobacteria bacterium]MBU1414373.1 group II truncated hemoglobin [Gammaproteobacteria bacterium]
MNRDGITPYERIGGEPVVRALVKRFYELMDTLPEAYDVRKLHAADLSGSEEKLYLFLTGWLGGPQLYVEKFGPPHLRQRHLPFAIGMAERDQWLLCMRQAMEEHIDDAPLRSALDKALTELADFMRNQPG